MLDTGVRNEKTRMAGYPETDLPEMTAERNPHWKAAKQYRQDREYSEAANSYTLAVHERFADCEYVREPFERAAPTVAFGLYSQLAAGICYRIVGEETRCMNRCRQGILLCEELRDHVVSYEAQKGVMDEYIGDFKTIGNFGTPADDYQAARKRYEGVTNPIQWQAEPEFEMNLTFMLDLLDATGKSLERQHKREITAESLMTRIEYKMDEFDEIVETIVASGSWT